MKHSYQITGMSCNGCRTKVENTLNSIEGVSAVVTLAPPIATITMKNHISIKQFQTFLSAAGNYTIKEADNKLVNSKNKENKFQDSVSDTANLLPTNSGGKYYCPMHCEGDKMYDKPGDCPVCGMHLVQEQSFLQTVQYTCPMHPEIIKDEPGACPICGMDLVPLKPSESDESKVYDDLLKKMKVALAFTIPVFLIAMISMIPNNPLMKLMDMQMWNYAQFILTLPVVFYACWMFFLRAWKSIITWNLNMFTLVGIGTGVAFLFSIVGMLFPDIFPTEFKSMDGSVSLYFEATAVILTLVLLGQLLEAKAHSQTSGAIKELLKLAPTEATLVLDGKDSVISINAIKKGDILRVKPGDKIPVDGKIVDYR
jgi:P-type Cu+ transporter